MFAHSGLKNQHGLLALCWARAVVQGQSAIGLSFLTASTLEAYSLTAAHVCLGRRCWLSAVRAHVCSLYVCLPFSLRLYRSRLRGEKRRQGDVRHLDASMLHFMCLFAYLVHRQTKHSPAAKVLRQGINSESSDVLLNGTEQWRGYQL